MQPWVLLGMGEAIEFAARKRRVSQRIKKQKLCHKRPSLAPGGTKACGSGAPKQRHRRTKLIRAAARAPPRGATSERWRVRGPSARPRYNFPVSENIFLQCGAARFGELHASRIASGRY